MPSFGPARGRYVDKPAGITPLALAYGVGLGLALSAPALPAAGSAWLLAASGGAIALIGLLRRRAVWLLLAAACAGATAGLLTAEETLGRRLPLALEGADAVLTGVIADLPQMNALRARFPVDVERLTVAGRAVPGPRRVLLSWYGARPALRAGERWQLPVRLKAPRGFVNPSGFDYERWLAGAGIDATGYVTSAHAQRVPAGAATAPVQRLRHAIADRLDRHLPAGDAGGLVRGLAIGVGSAVGPATWRTLRDTGTAHLLAISGLHVSLSGLLVYALTRRLWPCWPVLARRWPAPWAAAGAATLAVFVYAALAGFAVPARRTALMFSVAALGAASGRVTSPARLLVLAGLVVLLLDPLALLASGFWLSFGAVAILLWLALGRARPPDDDPSAPPAGSLRRAWLGAERTARGAVRLQVAVALALTPLTLGFFGLLSPSAVPANLIAVPLLGLVAVPLTLLGVLALPVPALAAPLLFAAERVCAGTLALLGSLQATLPALLWPPVPWPLLAAAGVGVLVLLAPRGLPGRWLGLLWCLPALLYRPAVPDEGVFAATVLDVGQGLAVVVRTRAHALVYDSGPRFSDRFSAGEAIVLPELARRGVRRLDLLLLSHGDADHAGAADDILAGVTTDRVLSGTPEQMVGGGPVAPCQNGERWTWDGVLFELFAPGADVGGAGDNDRSCVLRVRDAAGRSLLLTGDIEVPAQRQWLRSGVTAPVDVLLAPHHGSRGALHAPLIARLQPREVIFSAGYRSRFGHPHREVTSAYRAARARLWNTAQEGAVSIGSGADGLELRGQRARYPRWWRAGAPEAP